MSSQQDSASNINQIKLKLERLKIAHEKIGTVIEELTKEKKLLTLSTSKEPPRRKQVETETRGNLEDFKKLIGQRVRIINPSRLGETHGIVEKIGTLYVIIRLPDGTKTRRIPRNLRIIQS